MAKPPKSKSTGDTKVKRHHKKRSSQNPMAKFTSAEISAYDRLILAEDDLESMRAKTLIRNKNLPDLSFAVLEFVVRNVEIPVHYSSCPSGEIAQFNKWCEGIRKQEQHIEKLKEKCKRILDTLK